MRHETNQSETLGVVFIKIKNENSVEGYQWRLMGWNIKTNSAPQISKGVLKRVTIEKS